MDFNKSSNAAKASDDLMTDRRIGATVGFSLYYLRHSDNADDGYLDSLLLHCESIDDATLPRELRTWEILSSHVPDKIRSLGVTGTKVRKPFHPRTHEMPNPSPVKFVQFQFDFETVSLWERHDLERDACVFQTQDVLTQN